MNIVMPMITVSMTSPSNEANPAKFTSRTTVTDWDTILQNVVNDAQAVPFTLHVNGMSAAECADGKVHPR